MSRFPHSYLLSASHVSVLRHLAQAECLLSFAAIGCSLPSPLTTLPPSAISLCLAAVSWWQPCCKLDITSWTRACSLVDTTKLCQDLFGSCRPTLGEITTIYIEHLTFNTWTESQIQITLVVRVRIYPASESIICFDSQVISRILRDTW